MTLDITTFAPLLRSLAAAGLPYLGTAVGAMLTPVVGPFGMLVSPAINLAVSGITTALGLPATATPAEIAAHVDADPSAARTALAGLEEQHRSALAAQQQADATALASQAQQVGIDTVEATSGDRVAAWARPAILWGLGALLMLSSGLPYLVWALVNVGVSVTTPPTLDTVATGILAALLGVTVAAHAVAAPTRKAR